MEINNKNVVVTDDASDFDRATVELDVSKALMVPYNAIKGTIVMTISIARELAVFGIRVLSLFQVLPTPLFLKLRLCSLNV